MDNEAGIVNNPPEPAPAVPGLPDNSVPPNNNRKKWLLALGVLVVVVIIAVAAILMLRGNSPKTKTVSDNAKSTKTTTEVSESIQGLQLDTSKNYGDKYSNGLLPVGDGKYTTSGPKQGDIYACSQYAQNLSTSQGGASIRGPWFTDNNTEYNVNEKIHVEGDVMWSNANYTDTISGDTRTIVTNDLPNGEPTGIFPIAVSDPAYQYDHNPNSIKAQDLTYSLPLNPTYGSPNCMGGEAGIMLTGVALFNAFDAGGRDAGAWEVQDTCDGHPQSDGIYHYHTLSSCLKDTLVSNVIGFALDGFPITGPEVAPNDYLTTADLDVCHGIVSKIYLDGKYVTMYHYVMTEDYPYSVSCFRGNAIQPPDLAQHQARPVNQ